MVRNLCGMQAQARHRLQHRLVPHATRGNRKRLTYLAFDVNWQEKRYKQFACRLDELCQRHRYTNTCTVHVYVHVCVFVVYITCVWACQCQRSANEGRLRCGCCCFLFTCSFICLRRILLTAHTHTRILIHIVSLCSSLLNESLCVIGSITWPQLDIETGATHTHCGRAKVDKHTDSMIHLLSENSNFNRIVYLILRSF